MVSTIKISFNGFFQIGHRRQFYRGYCRVPYPSTLIDGLYDPAWASFGPLAPIEPVGTGDSTIITGKTLGLGVGMHGDNTIVTGDVAHDSAESPTKQDEMKRIMERLIQKMVAPKSKEENKNSPLPIFDGISDRLQRPKAVHKPPTAPKVKIKI